MSEIKNGTRLRFLDGGPDPIEGVCNGTPWVFWDGVNAQARIPVYVPQENRCFDVAGENVFSVEGYRDQSGRVRFSVKV